MWLHAFAVSPREAAILGAIYTLLRVPYPLVLGGRMGRGVPMRLLPFTFGGYAVLLVYGVRIGMAVV